MKNNAFKMSLLFILFVGIGIVTRVFLLSSFTGKSFSDQLGVSELACIFAQC